MKKITQVFHCTSSMLQNLVFVYSNPCPNNKDDVSWGSKTVEMKFRLPATL
jgi:hypothetical protein